eukprot:117796-Prorocentrum_minimum.AAC.2
MRSVGASRVLLRRPRRETSGACTKRKPPILGASGAGRARRRAVESTLSKLAHPEGGPRDGSLGVRRHLRRRRVECRRRHLHDVRGSRRPRQLHVQREHARRVGREHQMVRARLEGPGVRVRVRHRGVHARVVVAVEAAHEHVRLLARRHHERARQRPGAVAREHQHVGRVGGALAEAGGHARVGQGDAPERNRHVVGARRPCRDGGPVQAGAGHGLDRGGKEGGRGHRHREVARVVDAAGRGGKEGHAVRVR